MAQAMIDARRLAEEAEATTSSSAHEGKICMKFALLDGVSESGWAELASQLPDWVKSKGFNILGFEFRRSKRAAVQKRVDARVDARGIRIPRAARVARWPNDTGRPWKFAVTQGSEPTSWLSLREVKSLPGGEAALQHYKAQSRASREGGHVEREL